MAPTANDFLDLIKARRTHYALGKELPVPKERVREIVEQSVLHAPSAFNSQTARVVVLFAGEHDRFWTQAADNLKAVVPAENWEPTGKKLAGFGAAAGTILFFEDQPTTKTLEGQFALFADKFQSWAQQADAILQFAVWTALAAEGVGASLQHYNPIVDDKVHETWGVPRDWRLNAQLVFGAKLGKPNDKTFKPIEERVKVYGA